MKPALFVTGHAPADRRGAFECLGQAEDVEFALFGGRLRHGPARVGVARAAIETDDAGGELATPHRHVSQRQVLALAASGRYRAVICGTAGRLALPSAYAGARRAGIPFLLWASLWSHPRSVAHAASWPLMRRIYRGADVVITYGPHVSAYVRRHGAHNVHEAPQAVDGSFWGAQVADDDLRRAQLAWRGAAFRALFVGRPAREKGLRVLVEAWRALGLQTPVAALVLVGVEAGSSWPPAGGAATPQPDFGPLAAGVLDPAELRNFYAAADVLIVPSIPTRTFREPWGLVVNEAMNQGTAIIASDAVGAAAGGLVRDGETGLVVPAGDAPALAHALLRLQADPGLRVRLGGTGREHVGRFTQRAWAESFSAALRDAGASRTS